MMRRARRFVLGAAVIGGIGVPWLTSCSADFEAPSKIEGLRVLAVAADKPFANPGDTVHLEMTYDAAGAFAGVTPSILWIADCFDPEGDAYYGCYPQFADLLEDIQSHGVFRPPGAISNPLVRGVVDWQVTLPDDIITNHPPPATGSNFGVAYVFFVVCAGEIRAVTTTSDAGGLAGNFPLGCFDKDGHQIGADGFVPGFTEVYAFADGRTNPNPPAKSLLIKRPLEPDAAYRPLPSTPDDAYPVVACGIDEDARRKLGCGNHPFTTCSAYDIDVDVDASVSERDPGSPENGSFLHEAVWVDWYTDGGDFDNDVSLLYDPKAGPRASGSIGPMDRTADEGHLFDLGRPSRRARRRAPSCRATSSPTEPKEKRWAWSLFAKRRGSVMSTGPT